MKTINTDKIKSPHFKDVSRYTRWINRMDEIDEGLSPLRRKTKWLLFLGSLFLFFVLSFILFPSRILNHQRLNRPVLSTEQPVREQPAASPFEMPVDSFENLLKRRFHEDKLHIPEKK